MLYPYFLTLGLKNGGYLVAIRTIMMASGKGGTGKSTVSVFCGSALAARGKRVLLVELDSGLRSVDIISGVYGKTVYDIQDVLSGRASGDDAVVQSPVYPGLFVISAPYSGGEIKPDSLKVFCSKMRDYFDYIIIDTAAGIGAPLLAARQAADTAVMVLTPDPVSMRDGRIVTDMLSEDGPADIYLVINRVRTGKEKNPIKDFDECIDTVGAQLLGLVPESPVIQQAGANGTALPEKSVERAVFKSIAARLCGEYIPLVLK